MSPNVVLLVLRIGLALLLYLFLGALFWLMWLEVRVALNRGASVNADLGQLVLLTADDDAQTAVFPLRSVTSLGRGPNNTVTFPNDSTCSLTHALITLRAGKWLLEDLNSRNGTLLNEAVIGAAVVLSPGDVVTVGQQQLRFEPAA